MKKYLKGIILSIAVFFGGLLSLNAASAYISVSSSSSRVIVGNTFNVTVNVSSDTPLGSWEYVMDYNSGVVKLISGQSSIVDYGNGSKTSQSYSYSFKAISSGSANIGVKSYGGYAWDESKFSMTAGSTSVSVISQAELAASYSKDNALGSLSTSVGSISPEFNKDTKEYTVKLDSNVEKLTINASPNDSRASVSGTGEFEVSEGENKFEIIVTAENGSKNSYILTAIVEDPNPIKVKTTDNKNLTIVKRAKSLTKPETYEDKIINISGTDIPGFYSKITMLTLVGLKDEKGNINLYAYDKNKNTYSIYREIKFNSLIIYPKELKENKRFNNYIKTTIKINKEDIPVYKIDETSKYAVLYGLNIETNDENYYLYDSKDNSIIRYNSETEDALNEKLFNYKKIIIVLVGESIILFMIIIFVSASNSKKKKKIKKLISTEKDKINNNNEKKEVKENKKEEIVKEIPKKENKLEEPKKKTKEKKKKLKDQLNEL